MPLRLNGSFWTLNTAIPKEPIDLKTVQILTYYLNIKENQMKLTVHKEDDALCLRLDDSDIIESEEIKDGIILDYNEAGKVVGIEVLYLSQKTDNPWQQILLETSA